MALRFTLFNSNLGQLVIDKADPIDINAITQTVKRSKEINEGVLFEIILDVEFIKDARQYIKTAFEQTGGIDAEVQVTVYEYEPNLRKWEIYATGQIDFRQYELSEDRVKVNINQTGFQTRALNLIERDVDIETTTTENGLGLTAQETHTIPFHSKVILKQIVGTVRNQDNEGTTELLFLDDGNYIQFTPSLDVEEVETIYNYPFATRSDQPFEWINVIELSNGEYQLDINLLSYQLFVEQVVSGGVPRDNIVRWFIKINSTEYELSRTIHIANEFIFTFVRFCVERYSFHCFSSSWYCTAVSVIFFGCGRQLVRLIQAVINNKRRGKNK